jgi:hypothetical protein
MPHIKATQNTVRRPPKYLIHLIYFLKCLGKNEFSYIVISIRVRLGGSFNQKVGGGVNDHTKKAETNQV